MGIGVLSFVLLRIVNAVLRDFATQENRWGCRIQVLIFKMLSVNCRSDRRLPKKFLIISLL